MNKGQWVVLGFVGLALATAGGYIGIQLNASPVPVAADSAAVVGVTAASRAEAVASLREGEGAPVLDAQAARNRAIDLLLGDPYGQTAADVAQHIVREQFVTENGESQWVFTIRVAASPDLPQGIAGEVRVDAATGAVTTRDLPFLD